MTWMSVHEPQWHSKRELKQMMSALHLVTINFSKLSNSNPYILLDENSWENNPFSFYGLSIKILLCMHILPTPQL